MRGLASGLMAVSARSRGICSALLVLIMLGGCASPDEKAAKYLARAQEYYKQGEYAQAQIEAQNAAQIQPRNAGAHYLLALVADQQRDYRQVIQRLTTAIDINPDLVDARTRLGTLLFFAGAFKQADEQATAASALSPDDPEVRVLNARLHLYRKEKAEAMADIDVALARKPRLVDALLLRAAAVAIDDPAAGFAQLDEAIARIGATTEEVKPLRQARVAVLAQQKRTSEVEQSLRDLVRDFPKDQEFQYQLARFYAGSGRVDEAEQVMRSVIAIDPGDVNARLGLAQFVARTRSPEAAERTLEAFIAEDGAASDLRLALGRLYEANDKSDAALAVYEELTRTDPESKAGLAARVRLAALRIGKGDVDAGRDLIEAVIANDPENADALLIRAGLRVRDSKFDDAITDARAVLRKEPRNQRAMLLMARAHALANEKVLARDVYRRLLAADPGNADATRELAALDALENNFETAEEVLRARLKLAPGDLDSGARLVDLLAAQNAWPKAEAEARRLTELPDGKGIGYLQLARVYRAQAKYGESIAAYRKALERNPEWMVAIEGLVATLDQAGKRDEALVLLQELLKKNPDNLSVRFMEGGVRARQGDVDAAQKIYNEIVAAKPDASMAWVALANLGRDDPKQRISAYRRGLAANPGNAELGLLLGVEYERARRYDDAISHYEKLLKANPDVDVATNNLASLLLDHRNDAASHKRALELAKKLQFSPNPVVLDTVGWAYYRNGDFARAVPFLERAVAGAGQVAQLRYHLGMAHLADGNRISAKQELDQAVKLAREDFPGIDEAREALKSL